jgi:hypothetical protein
VRVAMQKVNGVDTARVSLKEGLTILELKPNNAVTLSQLRTVIRNNGFVSKDAQIVAKGTPREGGFEVSGTNERLKLSGTARAPEDGKWQVNVTPN